MLMFFASDVVVSKGYQNAPAPAADPQEGFQMPGNFTGYEGFGGGNNFFNL